MYGMDWMVAAACRGEDPGLFVPDTPNAQTARAVAVCDGCPVREECLEYAMKLEGHRELTHRFGVFGGLTPKERQLLLYRRRNRARRAV
jgi:WhiB family redox-sensing transcriptional regulator